MSIFSRFNNLRYFHFRNSKKDGLILIAMIASMFLLCQNVYADQTDHETNESSNQIVTSKRLLEVLQNGGPLMIPIGVCSFILFVFAFERTISLRKGRIIPGVFAKKFLEQIRDGQLTKDTAIERCESHSSTISDVFRAGVQKWGRPSVEVEQAILDSGERAATDLRKYLRLINGIATISPLLGLLGTVIGMIHAFDAIATVDPSQVDPKVMIATGISQALLTTAAGMTVAIPALIAYLYFSSRVDKRVIEIDALGQQLVELISAECLVERTPPKRTSTKPKTKEKQAA
jgi:biopolymer transport protein ExbB